MGILLIFAAFPWVMAFLLAERKVNGLRMFWVQMVLTFAILIYGFLSGNSGSATYADLNMMAGSLIFLISGIILLIRLSLIKEEVEKK
jgi:hypothetical protein